MDVNIIHDVETRTFQTYADEHGHLVKLYREDWKEFDCEESPTQGELDTFVIGEYNQELIKILGDC